jgi:GT2 family glycosyltransferase
MSPLVSVVIPTYNSADYICHTLESVLNQTLMDLEVIVIDDGSTDSTQKVLETFYDRIISLKQTNRGQGMKGLNWQGGNMLYSWIQMIYYCLKCCLSNHPGWKIILNLA